MRTFAGEELIVRGKKLSHAGRVSVRGRFLDRQTISVLELHEHSEVGRDLASMIGLAVLGVMWSTPLLRRSARRASLRHHSSAEPPAKGNPHRK